MLSYPYIQDITAYLTLGLALTRALALSLPQTLTWAVQRVLEKLLDPQAGIRSVSAAEASPTKPSSFTPGPDPSSPPKHLHECSQMPIALPLRTSIANSSTTCIACATDPGSMEGKHSGFPEPPCEYGVSAEYVDQANPDPDPNPNPRRSHPTLPQHCQQGVRASSSHRPNVASPPAGLPGTT